MGDHPRGDCVRHLLELGGDLPARHERGAGLRANQCPRFGGEVRRCRRPASGRRRADELAAGQSGGQPAPAKPGTLAMLQAAWQSRVAGSGAHLAKPADTLAQQLAPGADDVEHLPDQPGQHCHLPEGAGAGGKCPIRAFGPTGWHHQRHGGCLDHGQMAAYRPVSRAARLRHHAPGVVATVLVATPELSGSGRRVDSLWAAVAAVVWQRQTDAAPGLACPVGAVLLC